VSLSQVFRSFALKTPDYSEQSWNGGFPFLKRSEHERLLSVTGFELCYSFGIKGPNPFKKNRKIADSELIGLAYYINL
jgi:hypothetical protein